MISRNSITSQPYSQYDLSACYCDRKKQRFAEAQIENINKFVADYTDEEMQQIAVREEESGRWSCLEENSYYNRKRHESDFSLSDIKKSGKRELDCGNLLVTVVKRPKINNNEANLSAFDSDLMELIDVDKIKSIDGFDIRHLFYISEYVDELPQPAEVERNLSVDTDEGLHEHEVDNHVLGVVEESQENENNEVEQADNTLQQENEVDDDVFNAVEAPQEVENADNLERFFDEDIDENGRRLLVHREALFFNLIKEYANSFNKINKLLALYIFYKKYINLYEKIDFTDTSKFSGEIISKEKAQYMFKILNIAKHENAYEFCSLNYNETTIDDSTPGDELVFIPTLAMIGAFILNRQHKERLMFFCEKLGNNDGMMKVDDIRKLAEHDFYGFISEGRRRSYVVHGNVYVYKDDLDALVKDHIYEVGQQDTSSSVLNTLLHNDVFEE